MNGKITYGETLTLGILLTVLASGGYALHSDIAQVRIDLSDKIDARFGEVDAKVDEVNERVTDLQERVATVEAIIRVWMEGSAAGAGARDSRREN